MKKNMPQVYNRQRKRLAILENAFDISYELPLNSLYTASFSLPADDPKIQYCEAMNMVELYDGEERVELFRIIGENFTRSTQAVRVYDCEHVLALLLQTILFKYHQIGNLGVYTPEVIRYVLEKQSDWKLGRCDFRRQYEYKWENENALAALFSIPEIFDEPYMWTYDTTVYPYTVNLVQRDSNVRTEVRRRKNMTEIQRIKDSTSLCTRLYCLGYGEGDNQLTIDPVNGGVPYLEADTIGIWGPVESVLVDRRFENVETLKAYGQSVLEGIKNPYYSYTVKAVDLYRLTGDRYTKFQTGDMIRILDEEDGISVAATIVNVKKGNVRGNPGEIEITIANQEKDIASSISDLQNRARINETYAQGSTNLMVQNFADNADPDNPASFRVYIPAETARINKILLSLSFEPFRGYSKAIEGGGESTETTESSRSSYTTSESGGGTSTTSEGGGGFTEDTGPGGINVTWIEPETEAGGNPPHTHTYRRVNSHQHHITLPEHDHRVEIPDHEHDFRIPGHSHKIQLPDHTHEIEFGIYQGETADYAEIEVDGNIMPWISDYDNISIVDYLSKDSGGKIQRNTWHEIRIRPDRMTRITASLFTQLFCTSRGVGDF